MKCLTVSRRAWLAMGLLGLILVAGTRAAVQLSIPDASSDPGRTLTLPIHLSDAGGLMAGQMTILFDPAVVELDATNGVLKGPLLASGWTVMHNAFGDGREVIGMFAAAGLPSGGGVLLNLTFTVKNVPLGTVTTVGFDTNTTETFLTSDNLKDMDYTATAATLRLGEEIPAELNITSPAENDPVHGTVMLRGTVNVPDLQSWALEVAPGYRPSSDLDYVPLRIGLPGESLTAAPLLGAGWNSTFWSDGLYTFRLRAYRRNLDSVFFYRTVRVDNAVPPTPAFTLGSPAGYGAFCKSGDTLTLGGSAEPGSTFETALLVGEGGEAVLTLTQGLGVDVASGVVTGTTVLPATGQVSVKFRGRVRDAAGNLSAWGESQLLVIDNAGPAAHFLDPSELVFVNRVPVTCLIEAVDVGSGVKAVEVRLNGQAWGGATDQGDGRWAFTFDPPTYGLTYTLEARAVDRVDNAQTALDATYIAYMVNSPAAWIHTPLAGHDLARSNRLAIVGTALNTQANPPGFGWRLEFSTNRTDWTLIAGGNSGVTYSQLALWEHDFGFAGRQVTLRLTSSNALTSIACLRELTNTMSAPTAVLAVFPTDQATGVPVNSTLDWTDSSHAAQYDVYVWSSSGAEPSAPTATVTESEWAVSPALSVADRYCWRVMARNGVGQSASPVWSFTTSGYPVAAIHAPVDGAVEAYPTLTILGTANSSLTHSLRWTLDYAPGSQPQGGWTEIRTASEGVNGQVLATYPRPDLAGLYTLRLRVTAGAITETATRLLSFAEPRAVLVDSRHGSGVQDGMTWATAFTNVQAGLQAASSFRGQVWIAAGRYYERLTVPEGLFLRGAFAGAETSPDQRMLAQAETTLDAQEQGSPLTSELGVRVESITLTGARATIGGPRAELSGCRIVNNRADPLLDAVSLTNCLVAMNDGPTGDPWRAFKEVPRLQLVASTILVSGASDPPVAEVAWLPVHTSLAPSPRYGHAMAFDPKRGRTVLFGGVGNGSPYYGDTWEFDGVKWTPIATAHAPAGRAFHCMAFHERSARIVLFGGYSRSPAETWFGDTWAYDGTDWREVSGGGPTFRYGSAMAYDRKRGKLVLFGGVTPSTDLNDETWEYDGLAWASVTPTQRPLGRNSHAMAWDDTAKNVVLFGGTRGSALNDTRTYDGLWWKPITPVHTPPSRYRHAMAWDVNLGRVLLVGGSLSSAGFDLWTFDGSDWREIVAPTSPAGRGGHALAFDDQWQSTIQFGGRVSLNSLPTNDTWMTSTYLVRNCILEGMDVFASVADHSLFAVGGAVPLKGILYADPFDRLDGAVSGDWSTINPASGTFAVVSQRLCLVDNLSAGDPQLSHALTPSERLWCGVKMTVAAGGTDPEPFVRLTGGGKRLVELKCVGNQLHYGTAGTLANSGITLQRDQSCPILFDVDAAAGVFSLVISNQLVCSRVALYETHASVDSMVVGATGLNHSGTVYWDDVLVDVPNAGNLIADPRFIDPAQGNFGLQAISPAIDAGAAIAGLTDDLVGAQRPYGAGYDIGCHEYAQPMAPQFRVMPEGLSVEIGSTLNLTADVYGNPRPSLQWTFNGEPLPGAAGATLTLTNVTVEQMGAYALIASNSLGVVTSNPAGVSVLRWVPNQVIGWGNDSGIPNGAGYVPPGWTDIAAVSAGGYHSLALTHDGHVRAWGSNSSGQTNVPASLSNVVAIAGGEAFSLALTGDGYVEAWGNNSSGQCSVPAGLSNVVAIAAGSLHGLAVKADGTVKGWGYNAAGQSTDQAGLSNVIQVAAGVTHSVALKKDGTVSAWGWNGQGQTGVPAGLSNVVCVVAGANHTVALKSDGKVVVWGDSGGTVPVGLSNVVAIAAGSLSSLALKSDATTVTWGSGGYTYTPPTNATNLIAISSMSRHNLALQETGLPSILAQPKSVTTWPGGDAAFTVAAVVVDRWFQWQRDEVDLAGQTNAYLVLSDVSPDQAGAYRVRIGRGSVAMVSDEALLEVTGFPTFIEQPESVVAAAGAAVQFSADARGAEPLRYEWYHDGAWLSGAAWPRLDLPSVQIGDAGLYWVVVANNLGRATSAVVSLTIVRPPSIVTPPEDQFVILGSTAAFTVGALGSEPLSYQWYFEGVAIPGASGATLSRTNVQPGDEGDYHVVVSNAYGSVTSAVATLTVVTADPPSITMHPQSQTASGGSTVTLEVSATGSPPLFYQWRFKGADLVGQTNRSLVLASVQPADAGAYAVVVSNAFGTATSSKATLTVTGSAPVIVEHPQNQVVDAGSNAVLRVTASGSPPLSYQWRFNGIGLSGATSSLLTLPNVQLQQAGTYAVVVSNAFGSVTSSNAVLTVRELPTLARALDAEALVWLTSGSASWFPQSGVTHDGQDAAQSGAITHDQKSRLQTTVTGPGPLRFWWKVSSEQDYDELEFLVDGKQKARVSGEKDWQETLVEVPAGAHTLEWVYSKDGSESAGADTAWVDEVSFEGQRLLCTGSVVGGEFRLVVTGVAGASCRIQVATELPQWTDVTNIVNVSGTVEYREPVGAGVIQRFYRAVTP